MRVIVLLMLSMLLSGCGYNRIQTKDEAVKAGWSEVLNQYKRRADLIPNLVNTVKGYAAHEQQVLTAVTEARAKVGQINVNADDAASLAQYQAARHVNFQANGKPFFDSWFDRAHGETRRVEVLANSFTLLPRLVVGTGRLATMHTRMAMQACEQLPVRSVRLEFETPRFVETLQWHRYRDHDPGSQWLREKILGFAQAMPPLPAA